MLKSRLIFAIFAVNFLFLFYSFSQNRENMDNFECICYKNSRIIKCYNGFKSAGINCANKNSFAYPYSEIHLTLYENLIKQPKYYYEYHRNLSIHNQTLINYMNYKMNECLVYPSWCNVQEDELRDSIYCSIVTNDEIKTRLRGIFRDVYNTCKMRCRGEKTAARFYDQGFIGFIDGDIDEAMENAEKYILICKEHNLEHEIETTQFVLLGESFIETMQFSRAIEVLTEAIRKDPENKNAYFHRSAAYFESGNFDEAIIDYLLSGRGEGIVKSYAIVSDEFSQAFLTSLGEGIIEGLKEFVPNLLNSIYGLHNAAWYAQSHPLEASQRVINASYEVGVCLVDYCKDLDWDKIDDHVTELKNLAERFSQLSESEKGQLMGSLIGKYGTDIFIGTKGCKWIAAYRDLRNANRICNLETMVISQANKEAMTVSAMKHAAEREAYLKKIKIHWDRQNKHIPGKHNFEVGGGIITLEPAELELLIKERVGTGQKVVGEFGEAGFRERIDFGKNIGQYALEVEGEPVKYIPTSKGIIRYAKDGKVHVVPSDPSANIK